MFFIATVKQYCSSFGQSADHVHPLAAFLLFSIALPLTCIVAILTQPMFSTSTDEYRAIILQMRYDADRFVEQIRTKQLNLTEEFHWIDRFPDAIRFLREHLQDLDSIHVIRYIFAIYNSFLMELLLAKKVHPMLLGLPMATAIAVGFLDGISNASLFVICQFSQCLFSWLVFAAFLSCCRNTECRPSAIRNRLVNDHFHYL